MEFSSIAIVLLVSEEFARNGFKERASSIIRVLPSSLPLGDFSHRKFKEASDSIAL